MLKIKTLIFLLTIFIAIVFFVFWKRNEIKNLYYLSFFESAAYSSKNYSRNLNYRIFKPKLIVKEKLPLLLYLHPWGLGGSDNKKQITGLAYTWANRNSQDKHPCYIIAPQCPKGLQWVDKGPMKIPFKHYIQDSHPETDEMKMIIEVINNMVDTYPIDTNRIYVVGYSMGATGTWDIISRYPNLFAASIIASGVSDTSKANNLTGLPIWAFSGELDNVAPAKLNATMTKAIAKHGGKTKYTVFSDEGHGIGYKSFTYLGAKEWLFSNTK